MATSDEENGFTANVSNEANNVDSQEDKNIIISELLTYTWFYLQGKSTADSVCKTVCDFYCNEEIVEAKKQVWEMFGEKCEIGKYTMRRNSQATGQSANELNVRDIIRALFKIDDAQISPVFVAKNLDRVPKWEPEEMSDKITLLEIVRKLEHKVVSLEGNLSECKIDILVNKDEICDLKTKCKSREKSETRSYASKLKAEPLRVHNRPTQQYEMSRSNEAPVQAATQIGMPDETQSGTWFNQNRGRQPFVGSSQTLNVNKERTDVKQQGWTEVKRKKAKVVRGKVKSDIIKGAPLPKRDLFVARIDPNTDDDQLKQFIGEKGLKVLKLERLSHDEAKYKSYKLTIPVDEMSKVFSEDMWPEGCEVRKFFQKRNQDTIDTVL